MTDAEAQLVVARVRAGESLDSIARSLHKCRRNLARVMMELGVVVPTTRQRKKLRAFAIIARYNGGESQRTLAREYGVTHVAINHMIRIHRDAYKAEVEDAL